MPSDGRSRAQKTRRESQPDHRQDVKGFFQPVRPPKKANRDSDTKPNTPQISACEKCGLVWPGNYFSLLLSLPDDVDGYGDGFGREALAFVAGLEVQIGFDKMIAGRGNDAGLDGEFAGVYA